MFPIVMPSFWQNHCSEVNIKEEPPPPSTPNTKARNERNSRPKGELVENSKKKGIMKVWCSVFSLTGSPAEVADGALSAIPSLPMFLTSPTLMFAAHSQLNSLMAGSPSSAAQQQSLLPSAQGQQLFFDAAAPFLNNANREFPLFFRSVWYLKMSSLHLYNIKVQFQRAHTSRAWRRWQQWWTPPPPQRLHFPHFDRLESRLLRGQYFSGNGELLGRKIH